MTILLEKTGDVNFIQSGTTQANSSADLRITNIGNETTFMTVTSSGNIGIGTTSPSQTLDVQGNIMLSGDINLGNQTIFVNTSGNVQLSSSALRIGSEDISVTNGSIWFGKDTITTFGNTFTMCTNGSSYYSSYDNYFPIPYETIPYDGWTNSNNNDTLVFSGADFPILTSNSTDINGELYIASASSNYGGLFDAFNAFDGNDNNFWHTDSAYDASTGQYTGSQTTVVGVTSYNGEWLQIKYPKSIKLKNFRLKPREGYYQTRTPSSFVIVGSNDGSTWDLLYEETDYTWSSDSAVTFTTPNITSNYSYFRIVVRINGKSGDNRDTLQIGDLTLNPSYSSKTYKVRLAGTFSGMIFGQATTETFELRLLDASNNLVQTIYTSPSIEFSGSINYALDSGFVEVTPLPQYSIQFYLDGTNISGFVSMQSLVFEIKKELTLYQAPEINIPGYLKVTESSTLQNVISTNQTMATLNAPIGITTGTINVSGLSNLANVISTNQTIANLQTGTINSTNIVSFIRLIDSVNLSTALGDNKTNGIIYFNESSIVSNEFEWGPYLNESNTSLRESIRNKSGKELVVRIKITGTIENSGVIGSFSVTDSLSQITDTFYIIPDDKKGNFDTGNITITIPVNGTIIFRDNGLTNDAKIRISPMSIDIKIQNPTLITNTEGNIGIGTFNPNMTLDVNGTFRVTGLSTLSDISSTNITTGELVATTGITAANINVTGDFYKNGVIFGGSSQWSNGTGSSIFYTTGNVGIGTTAPSKKLDVNGDINASGSFRFNSIEEEKNITVTVPQFTDFWVDGNRYVWDSGSQISSSTQFAFEDHPDFPSYPVNLKNISGELLNISIRIRGNISSEEFEGPGNLIFNVTDFRDENNPIINSFYQVAFPGTGPAGELFDSGYINITVPPNEIIAITNDLQAYFGYVSSITLDIRSTVSDFSIKSTTSGNVIANGNVGIGTNNPTTKLDVFSSNVVVNSRASSVAEFRGSITNDTPETILRIGRGHRSGLRWGASAEFQTYSGYTSGTDATFAASALAIRLGANGTDNPDTTVMTMWANGNIGIGTSAPSVRLDVRGTTNLIVAQEDGTGDNWRGRILSKNASADRSTFMGTVSGNSVVAAHNNALSAWAPLFINTTNGADGANVILAGSGNVGIGTTAPTEAKLHVYNSSAASRINIDAPLAQQAGLSFRTANAENFVLYRPANSTSLAIWVTGTGKNEFTLTSAGNIGIGTTSPGIKLDVQGSIGRYNPDPMHGASSIFSHYIGRWDGSSSNDNFSGVNCRVVSGATAGGANNHAWVSFYTWANNISMSYEACRIDGFGRTYNTSNVYGSLSDLALKENISNSRNYLNDINLLRVVKYSLKSEHQTEADKLGFIAQEVEEIFPNLVDTQAYTFKNESGENEERPTKMIKTSVLLPMAIKCIQELTTKYKQQTEELNTLKAFIQNKFPDEI